jgi:hypothetical protein
MWFMVNLLDRFFGCPLPHDGHVEAGEIMKERILKYIYRRRACRCAPHAGLLAAALSLRHGEALGVAAAVCTGARARH